MNTSTTTRVTFYVEGDSILAYFNNEHHNNHSNAKVCYSHIGQHSQAAPEYVRRLKKASPEQYKDLKEELESIGYKLIIL